MALLSEWLIACPAVEGVSELACDAHRRGLLDLRRHLPKTIAAMVREYASGFKADAQPRLHHEGLASIRAAQPRGCSLRIERGIAMLQGTIAEGVGFSEAKGHAVICLDRRLPEAIVAAAVGRDLRDLVDIALLNGKHRGVIAADQDIGGLTVWFRTARDVVPMPAVAAMLANPEAPA